MINSELRYEDRRSSYYRIILCFLFTKHFIIRESLKTERSLSLNEIIVVNIMSFLRSLKMIIILLREILIVNILSLK